MYGHTVAGRPAKAYIHQLYEDTKYRLEEITGAIDDRECMVGEN